MSEVILTQVREELKGRAMNLVMSVPIVHDVVDQLSQLALSDIEKLKSADVHIEVGMFVSQSLVLGDLYCNNLFYQLWLTQQL
jgi:hypothetical protein